MVKARHDAKLFQSDVAKKLRKPQSFVSRVESIQRRLDVCEFLVYTRALGVDPYQLLHTMEDVAPAKSQRKRSSIKKAKKS